MKPAFSTVACPDWTLDRIVPFAREAGYAGVELRSFGQTGGGQSGSDLACEPCFTSAHKLREAFEHEGVEAACLATSIRYDQIVFPPVIGRVIGDFEAPVRETKRAVATAASIECPFVRVFGFELENESRSSGLPRILQRLEVAATTARHTGVRLLLENGGSFPTAADLRELIERVGSPFLAAAYNPAVAAMAGEDPLAGVRTLGGLLSSVKLRDICVGDRDHEKPGAPAPLGEGDLDLGGVGFEGFVRGLAETGYDGWVTFEYDRMWWRETPDPSDVLRDAAAKITRWSGAPMSDLESRKFAVA
jgi:sugar phosphate isomerase/epimerase